MAPQPSTSLLDAPRSERPAAPPSGRITGLDGLRGIAAFVVVLHHAALVARPELAPGIWAGISQSPLKLLHAGTESVLVFFALSGLVVALPAMRPGFSWRRYYPARLLRLYLPVLAALLLSAALILLVPRDPATMPEGSWMRSAQAAEVSVGSLLSEASLMRGSYRIDNVLWSLRWEVIFSLLLPIAVVLVVRFRRLRWPLAIAAAAATVAGRVLDSEAFDADALVYLPVFLLGALMAANLDALRGLADRPRLARLWPLLAVLAGALLIASWLARPFVPAGSPLREALWGLAGVGAVLIVGLAAVWGAMRPVLDHPVSQWLGRVSFSLYLVHVPILATLVFLLGAERWWLAILIAIPVSLLVAAVFQRWVEAPSHRLARAAGGLLAPRRARSA